ncbi:FliA/WhiG family RNA polymerase sigma factor [bacterium]|nr:FliA/WhiG family RNA polymerase sigma factor [bacterium]
MDPEEVKDWQAYKEQNDPDAYTRICERHLRAVKRIVGRMYIYISDGALDQEDLVHAGVVGLINAIEKFDPGFNIPFIEFAYKRIRGAVYDELRTLDGFSSRSRRQKQNLEKIKEYLQHKFLRSPTEEETADEMGISLDQFRILQNSLKTVKPEPLDWKHEETIGVSRGMEKMKNWIPNVDGLSQAEKYRIVASQIDQLPKRSRLVLGLYYREGLTLKEIARVMDLTESRICQIHAAAIEVLQQQLQDIETAFGGKIRIKVSG